MAGRRRTRKRSYGKVHFPRTGVSAWSRPGAINLSTSLTSGNQEALVIVNGQRGEEIQPTRFTALDTGSKLDPRIIRIICRVAVTIFSAIPTIVEYWYGLRIMESGATGLTVTQFGSVFVGNDFSRREDWLWRGMGICQHTGAGLGTPVIEMSGGGSGAGIFIDCKPKRQLEENQVMVFHHGWRTQSVGNPPDATMQGTLMPEVLYWIPR